MQVHEEGHIIGNHSYTHATWFDLFSSAKMREELIATDQHYQKYNGK